MSVVLQLLNRHFTPHGVLLPETSEFRLCYVEGSWAWFANTDPRNIWGDDFDDAPFEHNCGQPYTWSKGMNGFAGLPLEEYDLIKLAWLADLNMPNAGKLNSDWSAEMINRGKVPWLCSPTWAKTKIEIWAGTTIAEFIRLVNEVDGEIYVRMLYGSK